MCAMMNHDPDDVVEEFANQLEQLCAVTPVPPHISGENDSNESMSEDEEGDIPFGYVQLPQEEDEGVSLTDEDEETRSLAMEDTEAPALVLPPSEEISEDTANAIRSIMSTIQLSDRAVPEWAKAIPESMWMPKLNSNNDSSSTNKE